MQNEAFDEAFSEFVQEFRGHCKCYERVKTVDVRHIAKEDGRQRFVIFFNGKQFDYFDFSATEMMGGDETDLEDIGFQPFDFTPDEKPLES